MDLGPEALAAMLERRGVLEELRSSYDNQADTVGGWVDVLTDRLWISDADVDAFAGDGPMVTDDRPIPEYFLLRRLQEEGLPPAVPSVLLGMTGGVVRGIAARVVLVIGFTIFAVYIGLVIALVRSGGSDAADYTAFYTGWTIVLEGRGADLYDPVVQAEVQREVLGGRSFEAGLNPFNNPPHLVLPFVPLALLPLTTSYVAWAIVQLALLGWLLRRLLTTIAADWSREERMLLVGASVALPSLALTLWQGAFSLLVTVAVLELYLGLSSGRERAAGVWAVIGSLNRRRWAGSA